MANHKERRLRALESASAAATGSGEPAIVIGIGKPPEQIDAEVAALRQRLRLPPGERVIILNR